MTKNLFLLSAIVVQSFVLFVTLLGTCAGVLAQLIVTPPDQLQYTPPGARPFIFFCETFKDMGGLNIAEATLILSLLSGIFLFMFDVKTGSDAMVRTKAFLLLNIILCQLLLAFWLLTTELLKFKLIE